MHMHPGEGLRSAIPDRGAGGERSPGDTLPAGETIADTETRSAAPAAPASSPEEGGTSARRIDPRKGGLEVGFGEFAITLEADEIRPGPVTFVIRNGGALVHGFEIEGEDDGGDSSGSGNGELKLEGQEFGPGEVVEIRADLPPGVYEIECFVAEHDDMGMRATLIVRPDCAAGACRSGAGRGPDRDRRLRVRTDADRGACRDHGDVDEPRPTAHTVSASDGSFDSGTLGSDARFETTFERAGTFAYFCQIHPTMRGTVRVEEPG